MHSIFKFKNKDQFKSAVNFIKQVGLLMDDIIFGFITNRVGKTKKMTGFARSTR